MSFPSLKDQQPPLLDTNVFQNIIFYVEQKK